MKIKNVEALTVRAEDGVTLSLRPVQISRGFAGHDDDLAVWQWTKLLQKDGIKLVLSAAEAAKVQDYMRDHETELLSDDGVRAFIYGDLNLVECNPEVFTDPEKSSRPVGAIAHDLVALYRKDNITLLDCIDEVSDLLGELELSLDGS